MPDLIRIEPDPLSENNYIELADIDRGDVFSNEDVKVGRHVTAEHPTALKPMKQGEAKNVNCLDIYNSNGITEGHYSPRYFFLRSIDPNIRFPYTYSM